MFLAEEQVGTKVAVSSLVGPAT